jgi:integrase
MLVSLAPARGAARGARHVLSAPVGATARRRNRARGRIEELPSGSLRVSVYAGRDPLTKRRTYLKETIRAGPKSQTEAERALTRLLNQVDEKRHPRTSATVVQLLDKYLAVADIAPHTKASYRSNVSKHVAPLLGSIKVSRVDAEILESLYAELRRCREHCDGRQYVQHRTTQSHQCDPHPKLACDPANPRCGYCRRICKPHVCTSLSRSSIRQIHWMLSGAFGSAVRWGWIAVNPADRARRPDYLPAKPQPPTVEEAAALIAAAARRDPAWGAFVWVTTTTGARRGEMCALHWEDIDLETKVVHLHRAIGVGEDRSWVEKDTKTHQHRRIVLDDETVSVIREHLARCQEQGAAVDVALPRTAYVFSPEADGSRFMDPGAISHRYDRMAKRLKIGTTLHKLRHYSATELINAGVDVRTVAGRLGHGGGGATTLRVYAAWLSEADQRAAAALSGRMPPRTIDGTSEPGDSVLIAGAEPAGPYAEIARDLLGGIRCGLLKAGEQLPTISELSARYQVSRSTARRAVQLLKDDGLVDVDRGRRATVRATSTDGIEVS